MSSVSLNPFPSCPQLTKEPTIRSQQKANSNSKAASQNVSPSNSDGHGSNAKATSKFKSGPTLTDIQKESAGKEKGAIEDWKQQTKSEEPWSPTGKSSGRSLGGLGSFVGSHHEVIDKKRRIGTKRQDDGTTTEHHSGL